MALSVRAGFACGLLGVSMCGVRSVGSVELCGPGISWDCCGRHDGGLTGEIGRSKGAEKGTSSGVEKKCLVSKQDFKFV